MAHPEAIQSNNIPLTSFRNESSSMFETAAPSQPLLTDRPPVIGSSHNIPEHVQSASLLHITEETSIPDSSLQSKKGLSAELSDGPGPQRIYWLSPVSMIGAFLAGVSTAIAHHAYYHSLDGQLVGNAEKQQWALRIGNIFAFLVKSFLAISVGIACMQWVWRTMRRTYITIEGIDAAFAIQGSILSFLNWEMMSKIKIGTLIALVMWLIPFVALVTPATLSVEASYQKTTSLEEVPTLDMSTYMYDPEEGKNTIINYEAPGYRNAVKYVERFAQVHGTVPRGGFTLKGASSRLARVISASAASGEVFPILRPFQRANMTYRTHFFLPIIKCETSSKEVAQNTTLAAISFANVTGDLLISTEDPGYDEHNFDEYRLNIGYFAMVPRNDYTNETIMVQQVDDLSPDDVFTNHIWIAIADQKNTKPIGHANETRIIPSFITCKLWNASVHLNTSFLENTQSLRPENLTYMNQIHSLEVYNYADTTENMANTAYSAFFLQICRQLTGIVMVIYQNRLDVKSHIGETALTGALDYVAMLEHLQQSLTRVSAGLGASSPFSSPLNKSLSVLIEELSLNVSLNMLTDSSLSNLTHANVTYTTLQNIYLYSPRSLILAYSLAIFFTFLSIILGGAAYCSNGMSHDYAVSSIIGSTQTPDLANIFRHKPAGAQPLDRQIAMTKLRFGTVEPLLAEKGIAGQKPLWGASFGLQGTVYQRKNRSDVNNGSFIHLLRHHKD